MHNMPYNMHNMQNANMQNNMQINMQNMLAIGRFGADCLVLTAICRICQIICSICIICYGDFRYAQYAFPTLLTQMPRYSLSFRILLLTVLSLVTVTLRIQAWQWVGTVNLNSSILNIAVNSSPTGSGPAGPGPGAATEVQVGCGRLSAGPGRPGKTHIDVSRLPRRYRAWIQTSCDISASPSQQSHFRRSKSYPFWSLISIRRGAVKLETFRLISEM